jgi:DNA-binding NarL/FixJ family response regulator
VLLAGMPPILRGIVSEAVAREPDMLVVGEVASSAALANMLPIDADVVIIGEGPGEEPVDPLRLLFEHPHTCVLVLEANGRNAAIYELFPVRTALGDVSPRKLIEAIRAGAADVARWLPSP